MTDTVTRLCHAKLNLLLRVLAREADGFHGLETVFCRIELADQLSVERIASGIELSVTGDDSVPAGETNLAWRAAAMALDQIGGEFGVRLQLHKEIPSGTGLGGGSSDAAATLHAVNQLTGGQISRATILDLATSLGADVPFLAAEASTALAWGHGERLLTLPALPRRPILVLVPDARVPTAAAYGWIDESLSHTGRRGSVAPDVAALTNWSDLARMGGNDFESVVFGQERTIKAAFEALARTGPILCRMSGSGCALFGVYRSERDRDDAAMMLGANHGRVINTANA